jgi:hypothetical protein
MKVVCNAQGRLQLLALHPSDPITVFSLLDLDPSGPPFSPGDNSSQAGDKQLQHEEVLEVVDRRYSELMELASQTEGRGNDEDDCDKELEDNNPTYKAALTAATDLLANEEALRFYIDTFLPWLEHAIHGQPTRCVWSRVQKFHRNLCASTWATTGMLTLLNDNRRVTLTWAAAVLWVVVTGSASIVVGDETRMEQGLEGYLTDRGLCVVS